MCGLYGIIGPGITVADWEFTKQLAWVSGLRGTDGSGMLQGGVHKHNYKSPKHFRNYVISKTRSDITWLLWHHEYAKNGNKRFLGDVTDDFFAGHVRAATIGNISDENAHPFELSRLIGMHNGTLVDRKYQDLKRDKTDSEFLFEDINQRGILTVLSELDEKSAYSIVLWDKLNLTMNFMTNGKRPLVFGINKHRRVLYWASEAWMLQSLASRNRIELSGIWEFAKNTLYSLRPIDVLAEKFPLWTKTEIKVKEETKVVDIVSRINYGPQSNIVPLKDPPKGSKEFRTHCRTCNMEMDLVEQFFGEKFEVGKESYFLCKDCTEPVAASGIN